MVRAMLMVRTPFMSRTDALRQRWISSKSSRTVKSTKCDHSEPWLSIRSVVYCAPLRTSRISSVPGPPMLTLAMVPSPPMPPSTE